MDGRHAGPYNLMHLFRLSKWLKFPDLRLLCYIQREFFLTSRKNAVLNILIHINGQVTEAECDGESLPRLTKVRVLNIHTLVFGA